MSRKEEIEKIIGTDFLMRLFQATGRKLSICSFGDKPDLVCQDDHTNKTVGIEITELLEPKEGKDRALNRLTSQIVENVLKKYASGGIVSIGCDTKLPEKKEGLDELGNTLDAAICKDGGLERFVNTVDSEEWKYKNFKIPHISIDKNKSEWILLTDAPLPYQSQTVNPERVVERVSEKAQLSKNYNRTDELLLLIRNPYARWEASNDIKQKIAAVKGENISSVWLTNWKMSTLPVQPYIIRIDY